MSADGPLDLLARRHGVERTWRDSAGRRRTVSDEALAGVLRSLGVPLDETSGKMLEESARSALRAADAADAVQALPPVVAWRAHLGPPEVPITLPFPLRGTWITFEHEDGTRSRRRLSDVAVDLGTERRDGRRRHRLSLDVGRLAAPPIGYHRIVIEHGDDGQTASAIVAPARCPELEPSWGVMAPLWALRSEEDWGTGSLGDLGALADWTASLGATIVGTLPLFAPHLDGSDADPSPYRPSTRLAWNVAFVDTTALAKRLGRPAPPPPAGAGASPLADVAGAARAKSAWLGTIAPTLAEDTRCRQPSPVALAWRRWLQAHPERVVFSRFAAARAASEQPARSLARRSSATQALAETASGDHRLGAELLGQWALDEQLSELAGRIGLYLDLPVGVHPDGFDPWFAPESFVHGASAGAPPDSFYAAGQTWGLPPLHPSGARANGYGYFIAALRSALTHASAVRIDHVMGLHRLWFVPEGQRATEGAYVRYNADELRAVVVLEATRAGVAVAGEDLGTVPRSVRAAMAADGMLRSSVWQFEATPEHPLPRPPRQSVATLGTHDLPRFATFLEGADLAERHGAEPGALEARAALRRALGSRVDRALAACLEALGASRARLVLIDLPDCWGERAPENRPGVVDPANFARRWPRTIRALSEDRRITRLLRRVAAARPAR